MQFQESDDKESCSIKDKDSIIALRTLLGCDPEVKMDEVLLFRRITVRNDSTLVPYKKGQAEDNRDSIAKLIYQVLFDYIVKYINGSLNVKAKVINFVGVLDIFGFELFKVLFLLTKGKLL